MGYLEEWRKRIEDSRIKKENEHKDFVKFTHVLGLLLFTIGVFLTVFAQIKFLLSLSDIFLFEFLLDLMILFFGMCFIALAKSEMNRIVRKIPVR
jgi:hypothetical protein